MSPALMSRLCLALLLVVSAASSVAADWQFETSRFHDDFESEPFPGWIGASTSPGISGNVLGPATHFDLFFMDFIDDLPFGPSFLDVSFDLPLGIEATAGPEIVFNGIARSSELLPGSFVRLHARVASASIPFEATPDLKIGFSLPDGPVEFTLDNVVVDWSLSVPEPSTAIIVLWGIMTLSAHRKNFFS